MTSTNAANVPPPSDDEVVAVCYLCHDGGTDDSDQPLRRDCACRGTDAGYVHLSCLAEFAAFQSKQASGVIEFRKPWRVCPSCHHDYQNELAIDIASKFVSFVRGKYPSGNTQRQVESFNLKMRAFNSMFERLQPVQKREAGVTANVLLSFIDRMKGDVLTLPKRYSRMEANAYGIHGLIALDEGSEESARRAVAHFENQLEVSKAIGDDQGVSTAKAYIAIAKSKYESDNNEELLRASKELYEMRVAKLGEEHEYTIIAGKIYAINLRNANRGDEARDFLTKLLATSKQILGPHHNTTKKVESTLQRVNR